MEKATQAAPPPYPKSYGTWKTLSERHSSSRSPTVAVVCSGAHSSRPRPEALRASAVPARSQGPCTQSALTSPQGKPSQIQREIEAGNCAQGHAKYRRYEPATGRCGVGREARMHSLRWRTETAGFRCLTFELSGGRRCDGWPARLMISRTASRARRHAVGSPLERVVRHPFGLMPQIAPKKH